MNHTQKIPLSLFLLALASLACSLTANRAALTAFDIEAQIPSPTVIPTAIATPAACTVTAHALNLRAGPGTSYPVLDYLYQGETLTILAAHATWWNVVAQTGKTGYINSTYCERKLP